MESHREQHSGGCSEWWSVIDLDRDSTNTSHIHNKVVGRRSPQCQKDWSGDIRRKHNRRTSHDFRLNRQHSVTSEGWFRNLSLMSSDVFASKTFPTLEWDSVQQKAAVVALWLQRITVRIESIGEGARRHWNSVAPEAWHAYHLYHIAGALARDSVQPNEEALLNYLEYELLETCTDVRVAEWYSEIGVCVTKVYGAILVVLCVDICSARLPCGS